MNQRVLIISDSDVLAYYQRCVAEEQGKAGAAAADVYTMDVPLATVEEQYVHEAQKQAA